MIKRGEIYFVDLNPTKGREQSGRRPVLILSVDEINKLPLVVTVVVGTKGEISREISRQMFVFPPKKAVCRWKPCSYVFRFVQLIRIAFPKKQRGKFRIQL